MAAKAGVGAAVEVGCSFLEVDVAVAVTAEVTAGVVAAAVAVAVAAAVDPAIRCETYRYEWN